MTTVNEYFGPSASSDCANATHFIAGTEYEIEDIKAVKLGAGISNSHALCEKEPHWLIPAIGAMRDGSLRNNGIEFITKPETYERSLLLFNTLHDNLELGFNPYTVRTSIHVHVNVSSLTLEQLKHLVLLYAYLEPVFFKFAGTTRQHNIHCVPLNYTLLPKYYHLGIPELYNVWSKYSAFNILPCKTIGTVEFRHLYGTGDFKVYQQWLTMLKQLWEFAYESDTTCLEEMLVSGMTFYQIQKEVLPCSLPIYVDKDEYEASVIDVKLAFV